MKLKMFAAALLVGVVLAGCSGQGEKEETSPPKPAVSQEQPTIKELVADISSGKAGVESASITSDELIIRKAGGSEVVENLPADEFFVSIAPYITQTHE
ncbi:hypothetical protein A8F94_10380 [Bacillus sp. FJAT-27225]|nr:hypothetical protein A8F94_10380 [Bacillus sp. FJAT-27225]